MPEELDPVLRLVEQLQAGVDPEESFRGIFQLYHPRVEAFFLRKGFSQDESRDLAQDAFLQIFRSLHSFQHRSSFPAWLFGIVNNVYKNELRWRRTKKRDGLETPLDSEWSESGGAQSTRVSTSLESPLEISLARERRRALREALKGLPERTRQCCILRYEQGLKYQEIAELMKISIETVKAHIFQGRQRLAIELRTLERTDDESR